MSQKLGPITGKGVHWLAKKHEPNRPHGGAVIKAQTRAFGKATPLTLNDLKFDTQVQLNVLYRKASRTKKVSVERFFCKLTIRKRQNNNQPYPSNVLIWNYFTDVQQKGKETCGNQTKQKMDTDKTDVSADKLLLDRFPSLHSLFFVLSSPHSWDCCLLGRSERGTVICGSEQVTACICVKSFDDAEQKGLQVSQAACHSAEVIEMSLCLRHSPEIPVCRDGISFRIKTTQNKGIMHYFLQNACRRNVFLHLTESSKCLSL